MANHYSGKRVAGRKPVGKRALSLLMALVMSLSLVQITAFAVESEGEATEQPTVEQLKAAQIVDAGGATTGIDTKRVTMSKTAEVTDTEGKFLVTLNVTTKDKIETVEETETPTIDVVLVIDRSGSMGDYGRLKSAKQAATAFVNSFLGGETDGKRKVAVVSFGEDANVESGLTDSLTALRGEKQQGGGHRPGPGGYGPGSRDEYKGGAINQIQANGGTNMQAGLKAAREILAGSNALYKYVILLSDGAPTYYYKPGAENTTATDIIPVSYGFIITWGTYNQSKLGTDYNYDSRKGTGYEENIDDDYVYNTVSEAYLLKDMGVEVYGIGISLDNSAAARYTMYNSVTKVTGADGNPSAETHYYDCNSKTGDELADELDKVFSVIEKNITVKTQAWEVSDVMGNAVDVAGFVGEANNAVYAYNEATNAITWLLRNITDPAEDENGRYVYTLQYYVTLKDAYRDNSETGYPTNASATLKYYFDDVKDTDGSLKLLSADFQQPKVKGYKADLSFIKVNENGDPLPGATFTLVKDGENEGQKAVSQLGSGNVSFRNIRSGYTYWLAETEAPVGYITPEGDAFVVNVNYGQIGTNIPDDGKVKNMRVPASYQVNHKYYDVDGVTELEDEAITGDVVEKWAGYKVTDGDAARNTKNGEFAYVSMDQELPITLGADQHLVITLSYKKVAPEKEYASYQVIHKYYGTDGTEIATDMKDVVQVELPFTVTEDQAAKQELYNNEKYTFTGMDQNLPIDLEAGQELVITLSYTKKVIAPTLYPVTVIHEYYLNTVDAKGYEDSYTLPEAETPKLEAGTSYTATPRTSNNGKDYTINSADPEGYTITVSAEGENVITIKYLRTEKEEPIITPPTSYDYYTVTVNYFDKATGEVIHTAYTKTQREYTAYDVTAQDKIAIEGYTYAETTGDALTGTLDKSKVINVYYTKDADIDDGNTPTTPAEPGSDIGDDDVPTTPAQPPKTGDSMGLWIAAALVSGMGLVWISLSGKKREERA